MESFGDGLENLLAKEARRFWHAAEDADFITEQRIEHLSATMKSSDCGTEEGKVKNGTSNKDLRSAVAKTREKELKVNDVLVEAGVGAVGAHFNRVETQSPGGDRNVAHWHFVLFD